MKNKAVIAVIVILILGVGGYGAYRIVKHFNRLSSQSQAPTMTAPEASPTAMTTLKALLALGVAQKCTFDQGTVYMSGGKVRGDFTTTAGASHMISMNNTSYIWMDGQTSGFKMAFDVNATPAPGGQTPTTQSQTSGGIDMNQQANYNCAAWTADATLFNLPKGVTFQDLSKFMASPVAVPSGAPNIPYTPPVGY